MILLLDPCLTIYREENFWGNYPLIWHFLMFREVPNYRTKVAILKLKVWLNSSKSSGLEGVEYITNNFLSFKYFFQACSDQIESQRRILDYRVVK